jgi:hypothetical protein
MEERELNDTESLEFISQMISNMRNNLKVLFIGCLLVNIGIVIVGLVIKFK